MKKIVLTTLLALLLPISAYAGTTACVRFYKLGIVSGSLEYTDCVQFTDAEKIVCKPQKKTRTLPNGEKVVTFEVISYENTTCREAGYLHRCANGLFVMKAGDQNTCFTPDNIESGTDSSPGSN